MTPKVSKEKWWLMTSAYPNLNWARMQIFETGQAEILDMDGKRHQFETYEAAKLWLLEDEFTDYESLDSDDEAEIGLKKSDIKIPKAAKESELVKLMFVSSNT